MSPDLYVLKPCEPVENGACRFENGPDIASASMGRSLRTPHMLYHCQTHHAIIWFSELIKQPVIRAVHFRGGWGTLQRDNCRCYGNWSAAGLPLSKSLSAAEATVEYLYEKKLRLTKHHAPMSCLQYKCEVNAETLVGGAGSQWVNLQSIM